MESEQNFRVEIWYMTGMEAVTCSNFKRIELTERVPVLGVVIEGGDEPSTSVIRLESLSGVLIM